MGRGTPALHLDAVAGLREGHAAEEVGGGRPDFHRDQRLLGHGRLGALLGLFVGVLAVPLPAR
eukprot:9279351-Prorocentrum_lima.AAC.1